MLNARHGRPVPAATAASIARGSTAAAVRDEPRTTTRVGSGAELKRAARALTFAAHRGSRNPGRSWTNAASPALSTNSVSTDEATAFRARRARRRGSAGGRTGRPMSQNWKYTNALVVSGE